jgi:hypothetical protein
MSSVTSFSEASTRVSIYGGLTDNEKTFVAVFIPIWSIIVTLGIVLAFLSLQIRLLAWATATVYLISNTGSITVPKFILLAFRTMNRKLLNFLFILQFFLIIYIFGLINLIETLDREGGREDVMILFAVAGVINAVTYVPSFVFEVYRIKLLRKSQLEKVKALATSSDGVLMLSEQEYHDVYPPPPGCEPSTDTTLRTLSSLQIVFNKHMNIEYYFVLGVMTSLGVMQIVAVAISVALKCYYAFSVAIYWSLSIIPIISPRYADWTASHDHVGATQSAQLRSNVSYFLGATSVILASGAADTPSWVVSAKVKVSWLCLIVVKCITTWSKLYVVHTVFQHACTQLSV